MAATTMRSDDASRESIKSNLRVSTARSTSSSASSSTAFTSPSTSRSGGGGGILANADEPTPASRRQNSTASRTGNLSAVLKSTFLTAPAPGKQIKKTSKPIGKSFERTTPLSPCETHAGADVLSYDPRGSEASTRDGVLLLQGDERPRAQSTASSSSSNSSINGGARSTGASSLCAIRFAPLPTSGRLKRANSITIGVAARSQLISSQGSGRAKSHHQQAAGWQSGQLHAPSQSAQNGWHTSQHRQAPSWFVEPKRSAEVVDLGEELRKGALKAWRIMKSARSPPSPNTEKSFAVQPSTQAAQALEGDATPKRASSPDLIDSSAEPRSETYHVEGDDEVLAEGARTPRTSMVRRLSTGAFLGGDAVRGMQEQRRRDVLGLGPEVEQVEEQSRQSSQSNAFEQSLGRNHPPQLLDGPKYVQERNHSRATRIVDPSEHEESVGQTSEEQQQQQQQQNGEAQNEEDEEEEEREAQRLADEAAADHSVAANKAAGIEISSAKRAHKT